MKLLIVDDSGTVRAVVKRCFLRLGVKEADIAEAENGQTALDHFRSEIIDLVLTSWKLPVMDGLQLLKEIRRVDLQVPVVMATTESERHHVETAIEAGVTDYLVKPFTLEDLKEKIEKWAPARA
ncbi:MAG: response regulator [Planctomycetaceae bacterium]